MANHVDDAVKQLMALGFGEYEARAYVALVAHGPLSGYEVAKQSGVPRPNVYPVLQRLEERGAVTAVAAPRGMRYTAQPAAELLERLQRSYQERLREAAVALPRVSGDGGEAFAAVIAGEDELTGRARHLIAGAADQVVLAVAPASAPLLSPDVTDALGRGVQVTTLCLRACPEPCGACHGDLFRQDYDEPAHERWLLVVADDREAIVADLNRPGDQATGLVTRHPALVRLVAGSVRDGVAAGEIVRSLGAGLIETVDAPARDALGGHSLAERRGSWFERARARLRRGTS